MGDFDGWQNFQYLLKFFMSIMKKKWEQTIKYILILWWLIDQIKNFKVSKVFTHNEHGKN